jgi:hypothetical protein
MMLSGGMGGEGQVYLSTLIDENYQGKKILSQGF